VALPDFLHPKDIAMTTSVPHAGIWPALLTPLTVDLGIDIPKFAAHARGLIARGCTGVTPFGTTGEGPSFTVAERRAALEGLIAGGVPAERILVSTSCAALPDTLELTRHALSVGAHRCLVLPPFFLKGVPDLGVIDSYRYVIDGVADARLRVVLYHIPQISGVRLSHQVIATLRLLYPDTIVGLKDSGCTRADSLAYAEAFMPGMQVWVGNEPDLPTMGARGSLGAVSGIANVMPHLVGRLATAPGEAGEQAQRDLQRVRAFLDILGGYGMTAAFKAIMAILDGDAGWRRVRPPLVALDDAELLRIETQMAAFALDRARD
jgi:4-hydroxy-tetrahydrodipicolinate synthase